LIDCLFLLKNLKRELRIKPSGSAGGQNGMKNIIEKVFDNQIFNHIFSQFLKLSELFLLAQ
jgi:hypothetical protein